MTQKPRALLTFPILDEVVQKARTVFDVIYDADKALTTEEVVALANREQPVAIMIVMRHKMTAEVIARLPASVKILATSSVGFDHIDLTAAKTRNITVTNTPEVLTDATADLAFLLLLAAARRLPEAMATMASGWGATVGFSEQLGIDLRGKNLAIYGMGRIGQALAHRARAFGMKILYSNRHRLPTELEKDATYFKDLKDMLPHAQVLSLNAPASSENAKIINSEMLKLMPQNSILINAGRGSLVDEDALIEALRSGHLFSAGLDVFSQEPQVDPRFLELKNVVLTPHIASGTRETRTAMGLRALENMIAVARGESAKDALS